MTFSEGDKGGQKEYIVFQEFEGMSTQAMRQALPEKKLAWCENLQPIGANNLKTVGAPNAATTTITGETITRQYFTPINGINYLICFCVSGSGYAVNLANGAKTHFAPANTFALTPDATVWNNTNVLIFDSKAGYSTWNGTLFIHQGGVSPVFVITNGGAGYTSGATVAISGGSGSGATAIATAIGGVITAITLTNPGTGYLAGDTLTVTITPVSGGSGATATAHPWPFVSPNPTTGAVFQGRVFMASGRIITYTGTGGYDDFASGNASGTFTVSDSDLIVGITALRSLNNYLYVLGDNSVKQIGNLTVSSSITSFTLVTLSSDQGTTFLNSVISYNRLLLFANTVGVYAVFGSSVEKISDDMDGVFQALNFSQIPCAAVNDINNIHCYLLLASYKDPTLGTRAIIMAYMNKKWFVISQGNGLIFMTTVVINGVTETFATSGDDVTQIIQNEAAPVDILLRTALTSHGNPIQGKRVTRYGVAQLVTADNNLTLLVESENGTQAIGYSTLQNVTWVNNTGQLVQWQNNSGANVNFFGPGYIYQTGQATVSGAYIGATLSGSVSNYALNAIMLEFEGRDLFGSSTTQGQK